MLKKSAQTENSDEEIVAIPGSLKHKRVDNQFKRKVIDEYRKGKGEVSFRDLESNLSLK